MPFFFMYSSKTKHFVCYGCNMFWIIETAGSVKKLAAYLPWLFNYVKNLGKAMVESAVIKHSLI